MITTHVLRATLPLALLLVAATACTDDQKRSLGEEDIRDSLHAAVEDAVVAQGAAVDGELRCTASISEPGAVAGSCTGTTDGGDPITGAYTGTAAVDAETCTADLTITVGAVVVPTASGVDCFAT